MPYPESGGDTRIRITSTGSFVKPVVGDVWTIKLGRNISATDFSMTQDRGAGPVSLTLVGMSHTVQAADIPPIGTSLWPLVANANNLSLSSTAINVQNPATVPGAPTIGTATAGNGQAGVAFTAPASNGGSAITSYQMYAYGSDGSTLGPQTATVSPMFFTGLVNGVTYTFRVLAVNAIGAGPLSASSNAVTPAAPPVGDAAGMAVGSSAVDVFAI